MFRASHPLHEAIHHALLAGLSKAMVSLLPSTAVTLPLPNFWWNTRSPVANSEGRAGGFGDQLALDGERAGTARAREGAAEAGGFRLARRRGVGVVVLALLLERAVVLGEAAGAFLARAASRVSYRSSRKCVMSSNRDAP